MDLLKEPTRFAIAQLCIPPTFERLHKPMSTGADTAFNRRIPAVVQGIIGVKLVAGSIVKTNNDVVDARLAIPDADRLLRVRHWTFRMCRLVSPAQGSTLSFTSTCRRERKRERR